MKKILFPPICVTLFWGAMILALPAAQPKIYLSYDKSLNSDAGEKLSLSNGVMLDSGLLALEGQLNPHSGTSDQTALRPMGLSGQALMIGRSADQKNHYSVKYHPKGGLSATKGTFSFWLKPLTWNGNDANAAMFVSAECPNQQLFIYKYWKRNEIYFYYAADKVISLATAPISDWQANEWHHIACTWNKTEMKLYLDGQLQTTLPVLKIGEQNFDFLNIGTSDWPNKTGQSLIDEVIYYDSVLKADAVLAEYQRFNGKLERRMAPVSITVGKTSPDLDGKIQPFEYAFAGTGFFDVRSQLIAPQQTRYYLAHDEQALYIATLTPADNGLICEKKAHDDNLWEDDSIELYVLTEKLGDQKFQFIFNANGVFFDSRNNKPNWNAEGIECKSKISGKNWILEIKIPWSVLELDGIPPALKINLCRSFQKAALFTAISPSNRSYADQPTMTALFFQTGVPRLDLLSIGNLNSKELDFKVTALAEQAGHLQLQLSTENAVLPFQWEKEVQLNANIPEQIACNNSALPANSKLSIRIQQEDKLLYDNQITYKDITPVTVPFLYTNSDTKVMHLSCAIHQPDIQAELRMQLQNQQSEIVFDQKKSIKTQVANSEVTFNIAEIKPGYYHILLSGIDDQDNVFYSNTEDLRIPEPEPVWTNCQAGLSDIVPPPWTPLICSADTIACMGRIYQFGGRGLLQSIRSRGKELLASDIVLKINQKTVPFTVQQTRVSKNGYDVEYELTASTSEIQITVQVLTEFDGYAWFKLNYEPLEKSATISSMTLEIPLNRIQMTMFDDNRGILSKIDLNKETRQRIANDLSSMPFFWIGSEEVGLMGGMANLRGWHVKEKNKSMELVLEDQVITSIWNLVDTPLQLKNSRTLEFYLQATPVKDKNKNSRSFRESKNVLVWTTFGKKWFEYHIEQDTMDLARLAAIKQEREARKWRNFYYIAPHGVSPYSPDWHYFAWLWHSPLPNLGNYCVDGNIPTRERRNKVAFTYACFDSKSFFDYKIYGLAALIANPEFGIENLYYDLAWPKSCNNAAHGCAWTDDFGVKMASFDIRGTREFNKRTYQLLKQKNPDAMFTYHLISTRTPADSFADILVQGESYDRVVAEKESYYDVFTPDMMRIAYNSRSNEQEIWLIPQFLRALQLFNPKRAAEWHSPQPKMDYACKHFLGYLMTHDIGFMYGWSTREPGTTLYEIQDQLIWDEHVVFLPYWKPGPVQKITPNNNRILVSAYSRKEKALLAILNDTDLEEEVKIQVDTRKLFGKTDTYTGVDGFAEQGSETNFKIIENQLILKVPPRGFRCIFFPGQNKK
ncbi:MAG: glycoside hydrolase domain-containing protein [Lentisphaeria bacterium]